MNAHVAFNKNQTLMHFEWQKKVPDTCVLPIPTAGPDGDRPTALA